MCANLLQQRWETSSPFLMSPSSGAGRHVACPLPVLSRPSRCHAAVGTEVGAAWAVLGLKLKLEAHTHTYTRTPTPTSNF